MAHTSTPAYTGYTKYYGIEIKHANSLGVPAVVQWAKNLTAVAQAAAEAQFNPQPSPVSERIKVGCSRSWDSIPGQGTSICHECSYNIKKKKKCGHSFAVSEIKNTYSTVRSFVLKF